MSSTGAHGQHQQCPRARALRTDSDLSTEVGESAGELECLLALTAVELEHDPMLDGVVLSQAIPVLAPQLSGDIVGIGGGVQLAAVFLEHALGKTHGTGSWGPPGLESAGDGGPTPPWAHTDGRVYFVDGTGVNEMRAFRIRYIDNGRVYTRWGAPPFYGAGLSPKLARGSFAAIHHKPPTAPNQSAFPSATYFTDPDALVFGSIDFAADTVTIEWGDQSGRAEDYTPGLAIGPDVSLGVGYGAGNLDPMTFDDQGLPWLRYGRVPSQSSVVRVDSARVAWALQTGVTPWENAVNGADPATTHEWPFGLLSNLTLAGQTVFNFGGYASFNNFGSIMALDFAANEITYVMAGGANGVSPDITTPGLVVTASMSAACRNSSRLCFVSYEPSDERLYFSEDSSIRYITTPLVPVTSTLETLFTVPGVAIHNFIFSPDRSQVFYLSSVGLRCHDLSSGAGWCNDESLGPPDEFGAIRNGPNQLT